MKKDKNKKESLEKQIKRDLPASYYVVSDQPLTRAEIENVFTEQCDYLVNKFHSNYKRMLEIDIALDEVYDALLTVLVSTLRRFDAVGTEFYSKGKFIGYLLRSGWRTLSSANKRKTKMVQSNKEGDFGHREYRVLSLDSIAEIASEPRASRGSQDLRDDYHSEIWSQLWENLSEAVATGKLQFRDVAIYKHYMLHKYIFVPDGKHKPYYTINMMVSEGEFSRKQITNSLQVMNAYVRDYVKRMKLPTDINYEEEAEDIFGY
jgi:hypothetical protein